MPTTLANEKLSTRNAELEQGPEYAGDASHKKNDAEPKAKGQSKAPAQDRA